MEKRFKQLLESKIGDVKPLLVSEAFMSISPYKLTASEGDVFVTDTSNNKSKRFSLEVKKGFMWLDLDVKDFPNGENIKVSAMGVEKEEPIDKQKLLTLIRQNFNTDSFEYTTKKGSLIKFTKIS
jgi:hypothetical protein